MIDSVLILNKIAETIYNRKGMNVSAFDLRDRSSVTDYVIIAEGNVARHLKAICDEIEETLATENMRPFRSEGKELSEWIVMDYGNIIIHLMLPAYRDHYKLEEIFAIGKKIDLVANESCVMA